MLNASIVVDFLNQKTNMWMSIDIIIRTNYKNYPSSLVYLQKNLTKSVN